MNARSVTWKMCGAFAFHFHATAKDADKWTDDEEWSGFKEMRACFWGPGEEGHLNYDDAEKLFDEPEGKLPYKKFVDLMKNWSQKIKEHHFLKRKKIPMFHQQKIQRDLKF